MTDGSGVNHMKYNTNRPTVWAKKPGVSAFFKKGGIYRENRYSNRPGSKTAAHQ